MMTPMKQYALILAIALIAPGCSHRTHEQATRGQETSDVTPVQHAIHMQNNQFAFDLIRQVPADDNNFVISPFSISTALAMTYAGARGETMEQMAKIMHFDPDQKHFHQAFGEYLTTLNQLAEGNIDLNIANSLWAQKDYHFLSSFFEIVEANYDSQTFQVNYRHNREQIRQDINRWVYDQTREKIKDLIAPNVLTEDTRLVLVNAIHFLGSWLKEFDKALTREDNFYLTDRQISRADFMHRRDTLPYYEDASMQVLEIPYAGKDFSMLLVLPSEGIPLTELEATMDAHWFDALNNKTEKTTLEIFMPRFEAKTKLDLEEILISMGMPHPFSRDADFSGMTGDLELKIDKVIHQAMIEVGEEGTEAAAATAVIVIRKTAIDLDEPKVFRANRPFLFFVKDNVNQSILFAGRVMSPNK